MITNHQAIGFAISIGWKTDASGFLIKECHKGTGSVTVPIKETDVLQKTIPVFARKFNADAYAIGLWEQNDGNMPLSECLEIAQLLESDLQILARWLVRREKMISTHFTA